MRPRRWWFVFGASALVVAAAMVWISAIVLRLERSELRAGAEREHEETLRRAMWRMDSWLSVFIARESARAYTDYLTRDASSPLLNFESPYLRLHFHVSPDGTIESPQIPDLPYASLPATSTVSPMDLELRREAWNRLRPFLDLGAVRNRVTLAESLNTTKLASAVRQLWHPGEGAGDSLLARSARTEFDARVSCTVPPAPGQELSGGKPVDIGPLIPQWLADPHGGSGEELVFVRRLRSGGKEFLQGFFGDWPELRGRLLEEIQELFPDAVLTRVSSESASVDPRGRFLANIPVELRVGGTVPPEPAAWTPTRGILGLAWLVTLVATSMAGLTLHKSIELGERRRHFVSAVTHELRTPLTTFRMYSEMLADGMVSDETQRLEYLNTLKQESERLTSMVDNVLAHARLEERVPRARESVSVDELLSRVMPPLERRARAAEMDLKLDSESIGSTRLRVNVDAVGQILFNLVDNATKYACKGREALIRLHMFVENGTLNMSVRDYGPGVLPERARAIFTPFDRGGRDPSDAVPGIGLGLALALGLARDLGGDLTLSTPTDGGACFHLALPVEGRG